MFYSDDEDDVSEGVAEGVSLAGPEDEDEGFGGGVDTAVSEKEFE